MKCVHMCELEHKDPVGDLIAALKSIPYISVLSGDVRKGIIITLGSGLSQSFQSLGGSRKISPN